MKGLIRIGLLVSLMSSAHATETGYYNFTFSPDNPTTADYAICFYVTNQGGQQPFLEVGLAEAYTAGPYGLPSGMYNIVPSQGEAKQPLAIYMATSPLDAVPQYQYFLTAGIRAQNFDHTFHTGRYTIGLSSQPPPPNHGGAMRGLKPGGYAIVDTGSFSIEFLGGGCD